MKTRKFTRRRGGRVVQNDLYPFVCWVAQDKDGRWFGYRTKPWIVKTKDIWAYESRFPDILGIQYIGRTNSTRGWKKTLTRV